MKRKKSGLGSMPATHRAEAERWSRRVDEMVSEAKAQANHNQCLAAFHKLMAARLFQGKAEAHAHAAGDAIDHDRLEKTVDAGHVFHRNCIIRSGGRR